jgi:hypothetical protein
MPEEYSNSTCLLQTSTTPQISIQSMAFDFDGFHYQMTGMRWMLTGMGNH